MEQIKALSPWREFSLKVEALFKEDPDIRVEYTNDPPEIKIYVKSMDKFIALGALLPEERTFGVVDIKLTLILVNDEKYTDVQLMEMVFKGNPAFEKVLTLTSPFGGQINYAVFKKEFVQYHSDNNTDPHGNTSTLYQNLAQDVFGDTPRMFYCTADGE